MKYIDNFKKAQELINEIARIRKKLHNIDYNKSLKIIPDFVECYARDRFDLELKNAEGYDGIGKNNKKKYQIKYTIQKEIKKEKEKFTLKNIVYIKFSAK